MTAESMKVVGVLLAGGQSRRMGGGNKFLKTVGGQSILDRVIGIIQPQVSSLMINANSSPDLFQEYDLPVVADAIEGYAGPLAGVLTGMEWAAEFHPEATWMASFAADAPFVPDDLVARLVDATAASGADMACARSGDRTHPVFALWPVALRGELRKAMVEEEMRKIDRWTGRFHTVHVDFTTTPYDPFFNVNKPENLAEAEQIAKKYL